MLVHQTDTGRQRSGLQVIFSWGCVLCVMSWEPREEEEEDQQRSRRQSSGEHLRQPLGIKKR